MCLSLRILFLICGVNIAVFATVNIDCRESIFPLCNGDDVEITCLTEAYFEGRLRWTREDDTTLEEYDYDSELDKARMVDNITFTLTKKSFDFEKVILFSTAQFSNVSKSMMIRCQDTADYEPCHVRTADVSNPTWTTCNFTHKAVNIAWSRPSSGGECCEDFVINTTKTKNEKWFAKLSSTGHKGNKFNYPISKSVLVTNGTNISLPLASDTYVVHCRDRHGRLISATNKVHIQTETAIDSIFIEPTVVEENTNMAEYKITVNIQKTEQHNNVIDCIPPEKDIVVSCATQSMSKPLSMTAKNGVATCRVPLNETCKVTVTLTNMANVVTTKSASTDILARLYQALLFVNETCEREKADAVLGWQNCNTTLTSCQSNQIYIGIGSGGGSVLLIVILITVVLICIACCKWLRKRIRNSAANYVTR